MISFGIRKARRAAAALLALGLAGAAAASGPASPVAEFATARGQFEAGRAGSAGATDRAQQLFAQLLRKDADNPLYLAYYGSTFTLQARDTRNPWTRIKLINQGTALLDRALGLLEHPPAAARPVAAHPAAGAAALETRLVAIATFNALPEPLFHRRAAARREYQLALSSPDFSRASPDLRGHLEYEGALLARQDGDAATEKAALARVLALNPPSIDLAEVHTRLAELH